MTPLTPRKIVEYFGGVAEAAKAIKAREGFISALMERSPDEKLPPAWAEKVKAAYDKEEVRREKSSYQDSFNASENNTSVYIITKEYSDYLKKIGNGNRSRGARIIIENHLNKKESA